MTIPVPALNRPGLVGPNGTLSKPVIDLLLALVAQVNGASATDLSAIEARLADLELLPDQIEATQGFNGITVTGSLESGMAISGSSAGDVLANQIFGG